MAFGAFRPLNQQLLSELLESVIVSHFLQFRFFRGILIFPFDLLPGG